MGKKYMKINRGLFACILMAAAVCGSFVPAFAQSADNQDERLDKALEQIEELNRRFDQFERERPASAQEAQYLKDDMDEIFDRLNETEKKTLMDKVNFGVSLRTRVDNMYWEDKTGRKNIENHTDNFWSTRFRLRMNADVSEHLKFHGRMTMYKNWSDYDFNQNLWETNISERPTDTTMRLDRAYVDLIFSDWFLPMAFTVGRQPTVGGPPENLKDDTALRSTYPALLFQREMDAVNATFGLSKWTRLPQSAFRVMYGKFLQTDNDSFLFMTDTAQVGDDVPMLWVQAETKLPGMFRDTTAILTYIRNWHMPGGAAESVTGQPGDLGYNENWGFMVLSENFANIGLDWFVSVGLSEANTSGNTVRMDLNPNVPGPETYGLLTTGPVTEDHSGSAYYLGLRYRLPIKLLQEPKIGLEFNHGSHYWWANLSGSEDPFNKLLTRGDAWELYYIQPIVDHAHLRFGYLDIDYDYFSLRAAPVGEPQEVDQKLRVYTLLLDVNF